MNETVLIPDGEKLYALYVVHCLKKAFPKMKIIVCSDHFNSNFRYSKFVNRCYESRISDPAAYLPELVRIIRAENIDWLIPCTTDGIDVILRNRAELEKECRIIALPAREAFLAVSNKWEFHNILKSKGIPTPETDFLRDARQLKTSKYPLLLKPVNGESGVGIHMLDAFPEQGLVENIIASGKDYILQEFIDGYDIDCSVLCSEGKILASTIQMNLGEKERFVPGNDKIRFLHEEKLMDVVAKTVEALRWTGVAHIDLRYDRLRDVYHMVDFNPRFWGSLLGSYSVGVNFPQLLLMLSKNIDFDPPIFRERYFVSLRRYFKDALARTLTYGISETNWWVLMADPVFSIRKLLMTKRHKNPAPAITGRFMPGKLRGPRLRESRTKP